MIFTPTIAERERREQLANVCGDVLTQAAVVREEGRDLTARQRDDLDLLITACRWIRDGLKQEPAA